MIKTGIWYSDDDDDDDDDDDNNNNNNNNDNNNNKNNNNNGCGTRFPCQVLSRQILHKAFSRSPMSPFDKVSFVYRFPPTVLVKSVAFTKPSRHDQTMRVKMSTNLCSEATI